MTNLNAIDNAKDAYKAALLAQVEPINKQIQEVKAQLANLEIQKRTIEAQVKLIDRKPGAGRAWTPEAKKRLSDALKASFAKKKEAEKNLQIAETTRATLQQVADYKSEAATAVPVSDAKSRAANDDTEVVATSKKQTTKKTGTR